MSDRIDHAAEARGLWEMLHDHQEAEGATGETLLQAAIEAHAHEVAAATLALAEQQRISNLISLANSSSSQLSEQTATDAADALVAYHAHGEFGMGGWFELRPEIAAALGIDNDKESNNA